MDLFSTYSFKLDFENFNVFISNLHSLYPFSSFTRNLSLPVYKENLLTAYK